jgi:hypothetical protein
MLKKVWIGTLLIFMVSLAGTAFGQDVPSGKWWYNKKVVQNLNLTQKEISKLDQLYVKSHRKLIKLKNAVEREQFELDELLGKKTVTIQATRKCPYRPGQRASGVCYRCQGNNRRRAVSAT